MKLTNVQERVLRELAHKAPAWRIRLGRITTLESLEKKGLAEVRLSYYGWEARITEAGQELVDTMEAV